MSRKTPPVSPCETIEVITLKEYFEKMMAERDKAVALQFLEYMRRLEELNHERQRERDAQAQYVSKDQFEAIADLARNAVPRPEWQTSKNDIDKALTLAAGQKTGVGVSTGVLVQIISSAAAISAVIGLALVLTR